MTIATSAASAPDDRGSPERAASARASQRRAGLVAPEADGLVERALVARGHRVVRWDTLAALLREADDDLPPLVVLGEAVLDEDDVGHQLGRLRTTATGMACVVVALAPADDAKRIERLLAAGISDYVTLPVEPAELKIRLALAELAVSREDRYRRLQETTRRLSCAVQASPGAVLIADALGRIDYVNARFSQLTGFTANEVIGSQLIDRITVPDSELEEIKDKVFSGYEWRGEYEARRKGGGTYACSSSVKPVLGTDGRIEHLIEIHEDVTDRRQKEKELTEREEQYRAITENAYDLICELDVRGRFVFVSPSFQLGLGYAADELLRREMFAIIHPDDRPAVMEEFLRSVQYDPSSRTRSQSVFRYRHKNGQWRWFESTASVRRLGSEFRRVEVARDITERKRAEDQQRRLTDQLAEANTRLETMTLVDPLTGLLNRRGLQQNLTRESEDMRTTGADTLCLLVDLDDFKSVNDTLGYAVGDVMLKEVARKLETSLRVTDHVARIGGDEFMVILPRTSPGEGIRVAERTRLSVSESPVFLSTGAVNVTASFGLARVSPGTPSIDELLAQMHPVLRQSKNAGKNQVAYDLAETDEQVGDVRADVVNALRRGECLITVFHPIMRLSDETEVGSEALSRSTIDEFRSPADFLRLSQEANILTPVDHQCFKACLAASTHLPPEVRCHVNLLPSTIIDIPVEHLLASLPAGRPASSYCIEISEAQIIGDPGYLREPVLALKQAGIKIAIDDVGFGRTCLESLVVLEPDILKIDRKCVSGFSLDPAKARLLRRLFHVTKVLGADVVAEGIETVEDLRALREIGFVYGQGFYWGAPGEISTESAA